MNMSTGPRVWSLRFCATVLAVGAVLLVGLVLGLRELECIGFEAKTPRVEIINEFDFDLVRVTTGTGESLEEAFNRQDVFGVLEPGQTSYAGGSMAGPNNCVSANSASFFLRPNDDLELRGREPGSVTLDDFELVSTLGPGFCFETRRDSSWVVGEPFLTREDFDE